MRMVFNEIFTKETSSAFFDGDPLYNYAFLKAQESYYTDLRRFRHRYCGEEDAISLADVYLALGLKIKPIVLLFGWRTDSDTPISFNIIEFPNKKGFALEFDAEMTFSK